MVVTGCRCRGAVRIILCGHVVTTGRIGRFAIRTMRVQLFPLNCHHRLQIPISAECSDVSGDCDCAGAESGDDAAVNYQYFVGRRYGVRDFLPDGMVTTGELGGGDVKLPTLIGVAFGFPQTAVGAASRGRYRRGCRDIILLVSRKAVCESQIAYAPFLCLGAMFFLLSPFSADFALIERD